MSVPPTIIGKTFSSRDGDDLSSSSDDEDTTVSSSSAKTDSILERSSSSFVYSSSSIPSTKEQFREVLGVAVRQDTVTDRSSKKIYRTVQIGKKVWLAENLQSKHYLGICYDKADSNCTKMGWLYRTDVPECPEDFELPNQTDWEDLFALAKDMKVLRAKHTWDAQDAEHLGTDDFGFSLLPAGTCDLDTCTGIFETTSLLSKNPLGSL